MQEEKVDQKCGFVALLGAPNAGKSTLLNQLVGVKISIVSRKVQTTRRLIRGIAMEGTAQLIFVDTPGLFAPKRRLDRAMVQAAWRGAVDADVVALLVDAQGGLTGDVREILEELARLKTRNILILNKIDKVKREVLLALAAQLNEHVPFEETFMISALKGDGVATFMSALARMMPLGPWLYPEDQASDMPMRNLAAEITREKLFERLHDELPYFTTVETEGWTKNKNGSIRIDQTIYVTRETHKKMVIGEDGQRVKSIGLAARRELEEILETRIHLFLFVKVREHWENDPARYKEMGLQFPKG